ncbi:MAG TPA: DUF3299 domain-containing protein [Burkholderiales bacterium]|nr:DUF3299 domain-containing protein [Burkholderiales bacterium]
MPRLAFLLPLALSALLGTASATDEYRVGDRLPQAKAKPDAKSSYQTIRWEALVPEGWDPARDLRGINLAMLNDGDRRATEALEKMKKAWDEAPVEPAWNGQRVRLPGFVVPLERVKEDVTEFLLVPYFGACIHVPPPPANQIIHVFPAKPVKNLRTMDAVWVIGVLDTTRSEALKGGNEAMGMAVAGYRMTAEQISPYKGPAR